jgi:cell division protein FtsW
VVLIALVVCFGLLMVYSASFIYAQEKLGDGFGLIRKQSAFALLGALAMAVAMRIDFRFWYRAGGYPLLLFATSLLLLVLVPGIGAKVGGAQRWIRLGILNLQPGEVAKFALIFFVARQLHKKRDRLNGFVAGVLAPLLVPLPALLLLLKQPDFGTVVMIGIVILAMMFAAGVPIRFLLGSVGALGSAAAALVLLEPYRKQRLLAFLDPWEDPGGRGFQILQSLLGLYNGKFFGVGLGNSREKLFYLPEAHNDFIGAVIGEELGFLGVLAMVLAFLYLIYRGARIAQESWTRDQSHYGMLLALGITLAIGLQGFVNLAVVMGLLPTKGLTLPLISYGGSALVVDLFALGVLLSIGRGPRSSRWEIRE